MRLTYFVIVILICGFQCSEWVRYAKDVSVKVLPYKLLSHQDSVTVMMHASIKDGLAQKIDTLIIGLYYTMDGAYSERMDAKIGAVFLTRNIKSREEQIRFKYVHGNNLYAKQTIIKNRKVIYSPLLIVAEDE